MGKISPRSDESQNVAMVTLANTIEAGNFHSTLTTREVFTHIEKEVEISVWEGNHSPAVDEPEEGILFFFLIDVAGIQGMNVSYHREGAFSRCKVCFFQIVIDSHEPSVHIEGK
jgi:hypothetical protein